jgi:hypothetical protein
MTRDRKFKHNATSSTKLVTKEKVHGVLANCRTLWPGTSGRNERSKAHCNCCGSYWFPTRFNSVSGLESLHVPRVVDQSVSTTRLHISTQLCLGCQVTFGTYPAHRKTLAACNKTGYRASCEITNCNRNRAFLLGSRTLGGQQRTFSVLKTSVVLLPF